MCVSPTVSRRPCFAGVRHPSGSYIPSTSSSVESLSPEGRDLMEAFHLRLNVPRCLTLCTLAVDLCIVSILLEEASLMMVG